MQSGIRFVASVITTFVVSASAAPLAARAPTDDACSLVTSAQVSAAVKTSVGAGTYVTPTYKKTCTWTVSQPAAQGVKVVTVSFEAPAMFAGGMKAGRNPGVSVVSVGGLGESAYYLIVAETVALHLMKDGVAMKVAVYAKLPAEQIEGMEKTLAEAVVSKL